MMKRVLGALLVLLAAGLTRAGDPDKKLVSGPGVGASLPGPFDSMVINGEYKGRQHCLVCENRLFPVVMVFVREPMSPKVFENDGPAAYLLQKLNDAMDRHRDWYLKGTGIFLSPHAQSSVTREKKDLDAKELVDEAEKRNALLERLTKRVGELNLEADKDKRKDFVVLAAYPAQGPKGYKIDSEAEVTIVFFNRLKVLANEAYPEGKMTKEDVDRFIENLDKTVKTWKGKPGDPKKESPKG